MSKKVLKITSKNAKVNDKAYALRLKLFKACSKGLFKDGTNFAEIADFNVLHPNTKAKGLLNGPQPVTLWDAKKGTWKPNPKYVEFPDGVCILASSTCCGVHELESVGQDPDRYGSYEYRDNEDAPDPVEQVANAVVKHMFGDYAEKHSYFVYYGHPKNHKYTFAALKELGWNEGPYFFNPIHQHTLQQMWVDYYPELNDC